MTAGEAKMLEISVVGRRVWAELDKTISALEDKVTTITIKKIK